MAITGRSASRPGARVRPRSGCFGTRRTVALAFALPALWPVAALAQRWNVDTGVGSQLIWSSNPTLGTSVGREDVILDVRPHVAVRAEGARLRLAASGALNAITSANGTQPSRVLPEADVDARIEAIERFFYLDTGVRAVQTSIDPFGARPEAATSHNTVTTTAVRFAPSVESSINADTRYRLRSDNSWSRQSGGGDASALSAADGHFGRHSALLEHDPRPLGWRIEAERSETKYRDDLQEPLWLNVVRLSADYALNTDFIAGVRAGRERVSVLRDQPDNTIYGVQARWQPSPRTTLETFDEKRFFGSSWRLSFDHRLPRLAWKLLLSRTLDTAPQSLFELPATNNVSALLDAMFSTRFPDAVERAKVVQDLIARQGLPAQTLGPTSLYARRFSLVTLRSASMALTGVRNTLNIGAFQARTEDAAPGGPLLTGDAFTNNNQHGASMALSHRLTPTAAVSLSVEWSRIRALQSADRSIQRSARLRLNVQAAPKTEAFAGARYRDINSNVATEGREGAVFVGLDHRF